MHTVYDLFDCPELPQANYMLVRRSESGQREVLQIGQTKSNTGSLNLAKIRQNAASIGANEVHVHLLPETDKARSLVEFDLRAGQFGNLAAEPAVSVH